MRRQLRDVARVAAQTAAGVGGAQPVAWAVRADEPHAESGGGFTVPEAVIARAGGAVEEECGGAGARAVFCEADRAAVRERGGLVFELGGEAGVESSGLDLDLDLGLGEVW